MAHYVRHICYYKERREKDEEVENKHVWNLRAKAFSKEVASHRVQIEELGIYDHLHELAVDSRE